MPYKSIRKMDYKFRTLIEYLRHDDSVTVTNNTVIKRVSDDPKMGIAVELHENRIAVVYPDAVALRTCGWYTVITTQRLAQITKTNGLPPVCRSAGLLILRSPQGGGWVLESKYWILVRVSDNAMSWAPDHFNVPNPEHVMEFLYWEDK